MKILLTLACCLGLAAVSVQAEQNDNNNKNKKKNTGQGQAQGQAQHQQGQQGGGKHHQGQGQGQGGQGNQQNANQALKHQQHLENKSAKHQNHIENQDVKHQNHLENKEAKHQEHLDNKQAHHEKMQAKHFDNLAKGPKQGIESEKFVQGKHIHNSENWHGNEYVVFKNYHSEWHDHGWWVGHYPRVVLVGGGWYYWNAGFWFPAWGYDNANVYYPYDGPIYSYNNLPPDQVIANVQASLQAQGYYQGEVDGLLGPMTRDALARYQTEHGLTVTEAIDQPTLGSLGMS